MNAVHLGTELGSGVRGVRGSAPYVPVTNMTVGFVLVVVGTSAVCYYVVEKPLERVLRGGRPRPEMVTAAAT